MKVLASAKRSLRRLTTLFALLSVSVAATPAYADRVFPIPSPPQLAASAWVLMDAKSGRVLVAHDDTEHVPPASLTKMMTAYVAEYEMDHNNLSPDEKVRVSEHAWKTGGSRMFLKVGSYVTVNKLLKGIVIQSGNDASVALAEHIAGSTGAFAQLMNQQAKLMGLKNTHFMNPTGLPNKNHYSSAYDLAIIARHLIQDFPDHYELYSQKYFTYNGIRQPNRNLLLWRDKSVDGLKTGHTKAAGYCLVASAKQDNTRFISVVLGTHSKEARAEETQKLLSYGFRYFRTAKIYDQGEVVRKNRVWGGKQDYVNLGVAHDLYLTVPRRADAPLKSRLTISKVLEAPIDAGKQYGTLKVIQGDHVVKSEPLVALGNIEQSGIFKQALDTVLRFTHGIWASIYGWFESSLKSSVEV